MLRNSRPYRENMATAQATERAPESLRKGNKFLLPLLLLTASLFVAGCGNQSVSSGDSSQPPFNSGSGEGNLVNEQLVMTYSTGNTPTQAGLNTFYTQTICPSTLTCTGLSYLLYNINPSDDSNPYYAYSPLTSIANKPYLSAYVTLSFANYSGIAPTDILASSFYNYPCSNSPCSNLDQLYFTDPQYSGYDTTAITLADTQAENAGWGVFTNNAVTPLLTSAYATALMQKDTTNVLYKQILSADTYQFTPQFPVRLLSLEKDSVVTRVNSDVAYAYFTQQNAKGSYQETLVPNSDFIISDGEYLPNDEVDHVTEMPFMSILILNQINSLQ